MRRMSAEFRGVYAERRAALIEAIEQEFPAWATLQPSDQGMHLLLWLPLGVDDVKIADEAGRIGLVVRPISPMFASPPARFWPDAGVWRLQPLPNSVAAARRLQDRPRCLRRSDTLVRLPSPHTLRLRPNAILASATSLP